MNNETSADALRALAARVEQATGADRTIDGAIDRLFNKRPKHLDYDAAEDAFWHVGRSNGLLVRENGFVARDSFCAAGYTSSLDAALSLVPDTWTAWHVRTRQRKTRFVAQVSRLTDDLEEGYDEEVISVHGATPALALTAAALRALAHERTAS